MNEHYKIQVDTLTNNFYERLKKVIVNETDLKMQVISQQIKDTEQIISELEVWPSSQENILLELTLTYNYVALSIMQSFGKTHQSSAHVDSTVIKTLMRVLEEINKEELLAFQCTSHYDVEATMYVILSSIKNPITHFKMLNVLPNVLLLWSIFTLFRKQRGSEAQAKKSLQILLDLKDSVDKSVLKGLVHVKHDLLLCKEDNEMVHGQATRPSVLDVVRLVMAGCGVLEGDTTLDYVNWEWLYTLLYCDDLLKHKRYKAADARLERVLRNPLEPEHKSRLLCLAAHCYSAQDCPQLAIKIYQEALMAYKGNYSVLYYLAQVYSKLKLEAAEIEILALLIKMLKQKEEISMTIMTGLDEMIDNVCKISLEINLPSAYYAMAACCSRLKRHKEATAHYLNLLKILENTETFFTNSSLPFAEFDMSTVLTETSQSMVQAEQYSDCISFCDKFFPCWSIDDSLSKIFDATSHKPTDVWDLSENSQQSLFGDSQIFVPSPFDDSQERDEPTLEAHHEVGLSCRCNHILCQTMRKRLRSSSVAADAGEDKASQEVWLSLRVAVLLLLSKADALFAMQGATEETLNCLSKAYNLLVNSKLDIFTKQSMFAEDTFVKQPLPKRRRLDVAGNSADTSQPEDPESSPNVPVQWSDLVVITALKMAQVSWQRKQYLSVQNCCSVILQLDHNNINAHYLRTVLLKEQSQRNIEMSKRWLIERDISVETNETIDLNIEKKQSELKRFSPSISEKRWWLPSESKLLNLDIKCLTEMRNHK